MFRFSWLTPPTAVTLFRFALVPAFVGFHLGGRPGWALGCFALAALSDSIDGLLARLLDQRSQVGAVLDPLADKVLMGAAVLVLLAERRVPLWLVALIAFRDGSMALGAAVVARKGLAIPTMPSRIGKYATFALVVFVVLVLVDEVTPSPLLHAYAQVMGFLAGLCILISTTQYFVRFGHLWTAPSRRRA